MKKTVCFLLVLLLLASLATPAFATDADEAEGPEYYTVPVEYSDAAGERENLELMVQDSHVYVNARMLAERLGYEVSESDISVHVKRTISPCNFPIYVTFFYDSTKVRHALFTQHLDSYEAPFASVRNDEGSWIPFRYALLMMNSGLLITDDALLIDMPDMRIIDRMLDIYWNGSRYRFDWAEDFGYTDKTMRVLTGSNHLANVFNGLLNKDTESWLVLFQTVVHSTAAYDEKYGEDLTLLLCTEADKEIMQAIRNTEMAANLMDNNGVIHTMLKVYDTGLDSKLGELMENCSNVFEEVVAGNSSWASYNKAYQAMESVFDKQSKVYEMLESAELDFILFQKIEQVKNFLFQIGGFVKEFQNLDEFTCEAMQTYLDTRKDEIQLPESMEKRMKEMVASLSSNLTCYTLDRIKEKTEEWLMADAPLSAIIGNSGASALLVWNLVSGVVPEVSKGLASADKFELALYSGLFQEDTYLNYLEKRDSVFGTEEEITAEKLYQLTQYCYLYLKTCFVTREAALAFLTGDTGKADGNVQALVDLQNGINEEIAEHLVALKAANLTNKGGVYGFLLSDNREYLKNYDDSDLILWLRLRWLVSDAYSGDNFHIPRINMKVGDVPEINEAIANDYYHGIVEKGMSDISDITYHWNVNRGLLSLVIKTRYDWGDQNEYQVYNVSVDSGKRVQDSEVISMAGMTESEYQSTVRLVLGSQFFKSYSPNVISEYIDAAFYWEQAERTVSDENIQACLPYLNEEGQLCITGFVYGLIGPGGGRYEYNLEKYEVDPYCLEYLSRKDRAADSDSFVDRYSEILLRYPSQSSSYALYDIDKNGTPELIIREGGDDIYSEYWVYSYTGSEVVESECNEWYSYDAVFASGGNELIILYGGAGSSRIECLYRYKLAGGQLVYVEEIMNTEADSMLEMEEKEEALYAYLDQLTPLSFSPVSDTSSLENYRGA